MKKLALLLTMLMVLGFGTAANAMSIEIDFYGGTTSYLQGDYDTGGTINLIPKQDWVLVDIVASDVPSDNGVAVFSWVMNFDPSNMQVAEDEIFKLDTDFAFTFVNEVDNKAGTIKLEAASTDPPGGEVVLGTFRIDCTDFSIDQLFIAQLNDNNNLLADGTDFEELYPKGVFATVNQVPIPAAAWLLGSGLLGLVAIRRKKK